MSIVAGADACSGGWVAIVVDDRVFAGSLFAATFAQLLGMLGAAAAIGVDIPIGLPSGGVRAADVAARAFVGPRRSSVFPTPPRAALVAATYAEARRLLPSLSAQSFALGKSRSPRSPAATFATPSAAGTASRNGGGCSRRRASNCRTS